MKLRSQSFGSNINGGHERSRIQGMLGCAGLIGRGMLALVVVLCALGLAAPSAVYAFPWSIDMYREVAIQPLEMAPRVMPNGTLPVKGGMPKMNLEQMTIKLHTPLTSPTAKELAHGKFLFDTDCAPCHGITGEGDGTVAHLLHTKPANLLTGVAKSLPDGYIFGYIRNGGIAMPSYDDAMSVKERWELVAYVRELEHKAEAGAKTASK